MRPDHIALQLFELFGRYSDIGQESHAGVDSVNRRFPGCEFLHNRARALHSRDGVGGYFDGRVLLGDLKNVVER